MRIIKAAKKYLSDNRVFLGVVFFIALLLRLYHLGTYNLWYDESTAVLVGNDWRIPGLDKLLNPAFLIKDHTVFSLYDCGFMRYWVKMVGTSEVAVRLPSVVFSVLNIGVLYLIGKRVFNKNVACIAAALLAVSPLHIYYAQEARLYAAVALVVCLSLYFLLRAREGNRFGDWIGYVGTSLASVYFLYMTIPIIALYGVFSFLDSRKQASRNKYSFLANLIILLLSTPVIWSLIPHISFLRNQKIEHYFSEFPLWAQKVSLSNVVYTFKNFAIGYHIDFFSVRGLLATLIFCSFFMIGIIRWRAKKEAWLIASCAAFPPGIIFLVSQISTCYVDRYFFASLPLFILIVASALEGLRKSYRVAAFGTIVLLATGGLCNYYTNRLPGNGSQHIGVSKKLAIHGLPEIIAEGYLSGDAIVHTCKNTVFPLKLYLRKVSHNLELIKEADNGRVLFISDLAGGKSLRALHYNATYPFSFFPADYQLPEELERKVRLWVVFSHWSFKGEETEGYPVLKEIEKKFKRKTRYRFDGAYVYLFTKN